MGSDADTSLNSGTTEQGHSRRYKLGLWEVCPVQIPEPIPQISKIVRKTLKMMTNTIGTVQT